MKGDSVRYLSERVQAIKPSGIRKFFAMANELKGRVISLSIGEPDFVTPWPISEAGIYSLEQGMTHYTANQGLVQLRESIADYMATRFDLHYNPVDEVVITVGGSEAIDAAVRACVDIGDEVLVPEPCFVSYTACVELAGAKSVAVPLSSENSFKLTPELLEPYINERTKMIIVAYPNNPTGAIMEKADWDKLLPLFRKYPEIVILSDELYAELVYEPASFYSPAAYEELRNRVIVVGGFSKAFAMTGWRLGYFCADAGIAEAMNKIHQFAIMCAPTMAQYAAIEALKSGLPYVEEMRIAYNERRRYLYRGLRDLGLKVFEPLGAFYMFPYVADCGISSTEFCERLLKEHLVAIVPGGAFGDCADGYVRISYASSIENIKEALVRMGKFLETVRSEK